MLRSAHVRDSGATMVGAAKSACQEALTRVGARSSQRTIFALNRAVDYLEAGRWMRARGFDASDRVLGRTELFDLVAREIGDQRVLYLEFGVSHGYSMRYWSNLLTHPEAVLHGFDSFEGLPETWNELNPQGQFTTNGDVPVFDDPRVRLFKGWFEDVLPHYEWPEHDRLVVNLDADLYSSTRYVLDFVAPHLTPGSFVYFDEFMDRQHELRAFDEFLGTSGMSFTLRGATRRLVHTLFQRVA
jgi:hypothetical protein